MIGVVVPRECRDERRIARLRARRVKCQRPKHMRCKRSGLLEGATVTRSNRQ